MYNIDDTIVAVSSGSTPAPKKIVRITGDKAFDCLESFAEEKLPRKRTVFPATLKITDDFFVRAVLYIFVCPNSYTGQNLVEIHIFACDDAVQSLLSEITSSGCRFAQSGEFTYRAYLNAKINLSQAEAVSQIISSSNEYQLAAAQKLLGGSLEQTITKIKNDILELLSLIEAGLDFGDEDIELISKKTALEKTKKIKTSLNKLIAGAITYEQIAAAPSVVIVGAPNAGKSSLLNALVGENRSIVSEQAGTTRDVLQHWLKLDNCDCVLFDTAGLVIEPADILERLANTAALNAIETSMLIIFCVDITKDDYSEDIKILNNTAWAKAHPTNKKPAIFTATKSDLLNDKQSAKKIEELKNIFNRDFLPVSIKTSTGLEVLKQTIRQTIITQTAFSSQAADKTTLTARHLQIANEAMKNIGDAQNELKNNNEEIAAVFLRNALACLAGFDAGHIDEAILDNIFSKFCIGK
ncbi:MAG TPA: tRNA uridine-5-carboxymethylaminomethyl(34) synthesis GTPase MnmE [Phycisphaerales bacterium]|nr:MAG: tRNA uridine-5-carboxymethylaminomethyl(34) synthesis GTPase MnmE [Planctomycetes bacterium GWC2_45_44]HBG78928.1 tRNA uridine-5-carboxymethylaminomethyl(34) synthesis GTPase MnmE [Phycisphaerales bacterium]HBR18874.1 tRNA uridine-5-carboxymethylaminomethyl(34) synthesis GTPase MnmE [Phycisphaerales bacterium]